MRSINYIRAAVALAGALSLSACVATARPRQGVVYVQHGPPARVVEVLGVAPSRAHIWIPGRYEWRGRDYVWISGRYEVPGAGFRRYEEGQWRHDRAGWYWTEGRWR